MSPNRRARREHAARAAVELQALARIVTKWVDEVPGVPAVYLFGSRVRGDHRPDSDVDIRVYLRDWVTDSATAIWWLQQNQTDFSDLKAQLPGPLSIHREAGLMMVTTALGGWSTRTPLVYELLKHQVCSCTGLDRPRRPCVRPTRKARNVSGRRASRLRARIGGCSLPVIAAT